LPHWNWAGKEGQPINVWCHSNCERVELFLNGHTLGSKAMPRLGHLEWQVPYQAGKLEARGFTADRQVMSDVVETTGAPAAIRLVPNRAAFKADGEDVLIVRVEILDAVGHIVPTADNNVRFAIAGAARIVGVGNGDASSHEPDKANWRRAFNGLCMAIVGGSEKASALKLTATSPGLKAASVMLRSTK
jgi:beta-galactosidase